MEQNLNLYTRQILIYESLGVKTRPLLKTCRVSSN